MGFKDIKTAADVPAWEDELNGNRPQRRDVVAHILQQVGALSVDPRHVLELCPGPGMLAEVLLMALPQLMYTGIDFSPPILEYARTRLAPFANRAQLMSANLNEDSWLTQLPETPHAIVSMQSLHDLGGEVEVNRIYRVCKELLPRGGLFLNADLLTPIGQPMVGNPGRLSIPRHLELLASHGYANVACTLEIGDFGCFVGYNNESTG